jgi:hypothetical protein
MTKRGRITLAMAILALAVSAGTVWFISASGPPDPIYGDHRLSYWVSTVPSGTWWGPTGLDSNAVPYLIQTLSARDGPLRQAYIHLYRHSPSWIQRRIDNPMPAAGRKSVAALFLGQIGPAARPAIPELIRLINSNEKAGVRGIAIHALSQIGTRNDAAVMDCLTTASRDASPSVRADAVAALQRLDPKIGPDVEGP